MAWTPRRFAATMLLQLFIAVIGGRALELFLARWVADRSSGRLLRYCGVWPVLLGISIGLPFMGVYLEQREAYMMTGGPSLLTPLPVLLLTGVLGFPVSVLLQLAIQYWSRESTWKWVRCSSIPRASSRMTWVVLLAIVVSWGLIAWWAQLLVPVVRFRFDHDFLMMHRGLRDGIGVILVAWLLLYALTWGIERIAVRLVVPRRILGQTIIAGLAFIAVCGGFMITYFVLPEDSNAREGPWQGFLVAGGMLLTLFGALIGWTQLLWGLFPTVALRAEPSAESGESARARAGTDLVPVLALLLVLTSTAMWLTGTEKRINGSLIYLRHVDSGESADEALERELELLPWASALSGKRLERIRVGLLFKNRGDHPTVARGVSRRFLGTTRASQTASPPLASGAVLA
ncbi:MAG: hypothetical protein R3B96_09605 [Pirellulaceae bacterium]